VHALATGLARLPKSALGGVRVLGLTHLGFDGSFRVTEDLASFAGSPSLPSPTPRDHYHWAYAIRLALFRAARKIGADAVHLGDPHATPLLMPLAGCRRIVTCHDAIPMHFPERYMGKHDGGPFIGTRIERRRYRSADLVVAISDATKKDVLTLHHVPEERVVRVYNGVDVEAWAREPTLPIVQTLERFGLGGRAFAFYVGGYHWHKNIEGMILGLARARTQGLDLDLVLAGHFSDVHAALIDDAARAAGVFGAVRRIGYVTDDEVRVLYRSAVAHLLVSRSEGFGLTVIEAMASGCPVVTTSLGSLAEIAGDAALTVDPEDHAAIGNALVRVRSDAALRADLIRRGKERAPRFALRTQAEGMAKVYRRFLDA
jgi:glycosyltransferase involved in cell wall biosynthesis